MSLEPGLPLRRYRNQVTLKDPRREDVVADSVMQVKTWKIADPRRMQETQVQAQPLYSWQIDEVRGATTLRYPLATDSEALLRQRMLSVLFE